ncbi:hypothetical protein [Microbispora sp. NPDC049633]|uniref:hypothetical protein n=1 Tax=Microbispora sp. NPDC049633 TaxID=3154355 RepID=UPI003412D6BE
MHYNGQSVVLGSALLAAVSLGPTTAQAVAAPSGENQTLVAGPQIETDDYSPYQEGYEKGTPEGYKAGASQAYNKCDYDWGKGRLDPSVSKDAYGLGYAEAYNKEYDKGFQEGQAKYCTPPG